LLGFQYHIQNIPLIKLDIKKKEIEVIKDLIIKKIFPKQILVDFEGLFLPSKASIDDFKRIHEMLLQNNYKLTNIEGQNYSYAITPFISQGTLTCDNIDDCSVIQQIQTDISNKYDKSGGTINGNVSVVGGLSATLVNTFATISNTISANTISATTIDLCSNNGVLYTDTIAGCSPINVLDQTNFLDGLSATTISATTYYGDGSNLTGIPRLGQISTIFDGLGGIIQLGLGKNYITIPYNCILTGWTIFSSVVGSIDTNFYVDSYGNFPPTSADTIFTSINRPKITNDNKNQATGLNIPLNSDSVLIQEVLSVTNCTNVVVNLRLIRTT
jgi:hypothetical protein